MELMTGNSRSLPGTVDRTGGTVFHSGSVDCNIFFLLPVVQLPDLTLIFFKLAFFLIINIFP